MPPKNDNTEYGTRALLGRKYMTDLIVQISNLMFLSYI